ncbi:T cell receptor alpha variable 12-3 [Lemmus lemmus]
MGKILKASFLVLILQLAYSQPGDSATYFCAASAQCSSGTCSPLPNLQLRLQQSPAAGFNKTEVQRRFQFQEQCESSVKTTMHPLSVSLVGLWLQLRGVTSQQKVQQNPESLDVPEGDMTSLNCTFSDRNFQCFW